MKYIPEEKKRIPTFIEGLQKNYFTKIIDHTKTVINDNKGPVTSKT